MTLEELFEIIRREDCILWAGAGFSAYAGYPNSGKLANKIYKRLPKDNQRKIGLQPRLEDAAQELINVHSQHRKPLLDLIAQTYSESPKNIAIHKTLSMVPQIKTIITTNYDTLFERAYGKTLEVITKVADLPKYSQAKKQLLKIHGDVNNLEDIIITQKDYAVFYNDKVSNPLWITVKERLINNNIIFIGYKFGDINVQSIVAQICEDMGAHRRKIVLIAPGFHATDVAALQHDNISYIDCDAEQFVLGLMKNVQDNIRMDFGQKLISKDILIEFLSHADLQTDFLSNGLTHALANVRTLSGRSINGELILKIGSDIEKHVSKIFSRKSINPIDIVLQPGDLLAKINGITFMDSTYISKLRITLKPNEFTIDVEFENGFSKRKIPVEALVSEFVVLIKIKLGVKRLVIEHSIQEHTTQLTYEDLNFFDDTLDEMESFKLLKHLAEGVKFTITGPNFIQIERVATIDESFAEHANKCLQIYTALNKVERHFKFKIDRKNELTPAYVDFINYLVTIIDTGIFEWQQDEETEFPLMNQSDDALEVLKNVNVDNRDLVIEYLNFSFTMFDYELVFARRIGTIYNAHVLNLEEVVSRKTDKVKVKSMSKRFSESFTV